MLITTAARTNAEVQGLPVVAQDPDDGQAPEAASSSNRPVWPMPERQPEQLRETEKDTLEVATQAVAAKARGIPVMPPLAERQKHMLVIFAIGVFSV